MDYEALGFWLVVLNMAIGTAAGLIGRAIRRVSGDVAALRRDVDRIATEARERNASVATEARELVRGIELSGESKIEKLQERVAKLEASQVTHGHLADIYAHFDTGSNRIHDRISDNAKAMRESVEANVRASASLEGTVATIGKQVASINAFLLEVPKK